MFEAIKNNLEMAIRLKDKVLFDIAREALTPPFLRTLSPEENFQLQCLFLRAEGVFSQTETNFPHTAPAKECLLDDPTCENCSA